MYQEKKRENFQEVISMEEYLTKRRKIRENEQKKANKKTTDNSSVWMWTEVYV